MAVILDTTAVSDDDLLVLVKELNDYGEYDLDDPKLKALISDAKDFLRMGGVCELLVNSKSAVTTIAHYVDDVSRKEGISDFVTQKTAQLRVVSYHYE